MPEHEKEQINVGMSDDELYERLKHRSLDIPVFDAGKFVRIPIDDYGTLERIGKSGAFKALRKIREELGVFREGYTTQLENHREIEIK